MITVEKFKAEHARMIRERSETALLTNMLAPEAWASAELEPESFTFRANGEIIACAGIVTIWPGRGEAWAIINSDIGHRFIGVQREVRAYLERAPFHRIEATVSESFEAGHRWARMCGFVRYAADVPKYLPDGGSASLYARVK